MRNNLDEKIAEAMMGEFIPKIVKGKALLCWACECCASMNNTGLEDLKNNKMVAICVFCTVPHKIKPEWESE